jgi:acyl-CoA thioesterase FadM
MAVDYKSPGFEGHRLICEAWVEKREGRRIEVYSTLIDAHTKKVVAEARAVYQKVDLSKIVGR